jgi:hypothetical protein
VELVAAHGDAPESSTSALSSTPSARGSPSRPTCLNDKVRGTTRTPFTPATALMIDSAMPSPRKSRSAASPDATNGNGDGMRQAPRVRRGPCGLPARPQATARHRPTSRSPRRAGRPTNRARCGCAARDLLDAEPDEPIEGRRHLDATTPTAWAPRRWIADMVSAGVSRSNARRPVTISNSTHPRPNRSTDGVSDPHLLGRHVPDGPHQGAHRRLDHRRRLGGRGGGLGRAREAEVEDLHALVAGEEDVVGLHVAVDDLLGVRRGESVGDGGGHVDLGLPR